MYFIFIMIEYNKLLIMNAIFYDENVDFTFKNKQPEEYNINFIDDTMREMYRNLIWMDYEVVFIKGNRIT